MLQILLIVSGITLFLFFLIMFSLSILMAMKFVKNIKELVLKKELCVSNEESETTYAWPRDKKLIFHEIIKSFFTMLFMSALAYFFYHAQVAPFLEERFINYYF